MSHCLTFNNVKLCKSCNQEKALSHFRARIKNNKPSYGKCRICEAQYDEQRRRKKGISKKPIPIVVLPKVRTKKSYLVRLREVYPIIPCTCKECGVIFEGTKRRVFCRPLCGHRYHHRIRRKRERARLRTLQVDRVDPIKVFTLYQWHCANCGEYTPRHLKGKHEDNSPELDHIIPLSLGGEHSYINTQLLCRKCNGIKSNQVVTRLTG